MNSCKDTDVISEADNQHTTYDVSGEHGEPDNNVSGKQGQTVNASSMDSIKCLRIVPKCPIQFKPFIGQTFSSLDEAFSFYTMYGRVCGFSIRIGAKYRSRDETTLIQYWICHRDGWNLTSKPVDSLDEQDSNARNRKITRCGCRARLCVKFKDNDQYYVYVFNEEHNHHLASNVGKQFLRTNRGGLNGGQQKLMIDLGTLGISATKAHRFMAEMAGGYAYVGATLIDCKNFKRDLKTFIGGCDAQMVLDYLSKKKELCSDFTFEYYSDCEGTLCRLFWADSTAKRDGNLFGDVISFDATYSSNRYKMVFVPFTAVDNHKRCATVGAALISQEDANSYTWLLRCFKKFLGHSPSMLVTDQDKSMIKVVAEVFPDTQHRFRMWHITEKLKVKVVLVVANSCRTTLVVDQSGRGQFKTIQSAINSVPSGNNNWVCIHVNAGTYREKVTVPLGKNYIMLKGVGIKETIVECSESRGDLRDTATLEIDADNFVAKSITFLNGYNYPWKGRNPRIPAVAAFVAGDKISFYNCEFLGVQDTLYDAQGRHFFSRCVIVGAVDFIFGAGQSVYEDTTIHVLGEALEQGLSGFITANGRDSPNSSSWFIFIRCRIDGKGTTYLGRPWRPYGRVLFYKTYMSQVVHPEGWAPWTTGHNTQNTGFSEYECDGPGSDKSRRVPWRVELSGANVNKIASISFVNSGAWIENQPV